MSEGLPESRYANFFTVGYNAFEFIIDFGQHYEEGPEPRVHSRIVTNPTYAKLLLETLRESLTRYEQSYGTILAVDWAGDTRGSEPSAHAHETEPPAEIEGRTTMPERPEPPKPGKYPQPEPPRYGHPEHEHPPGSEGGYEMPPEPPAYPPPPAPPTGYPPPRPEYPPPRPEYPPPRPEYPTPPEQTGYGPPGHEPPGDQYPGHEPPGYEHPGHEQPGYGQPPPREYPPREERPGYPAPEEPYPQPAPEEPYPQRPPTYGTPGTPPGYGSSPPPQYGPEQTPGYGPPGKPGKPTDEKPCPKPEDQLKELQSTLDYQNKQIQTLDKQRKSLEDDLTGLKQTVAELSTILTAYKEACKNLKQQKAELDLYVHTKTPMLEAAVGDKRAAIEECIRCIDQWIDSWTKYAQHLEPKAKGAAEAATKAAEAAADAQKAYDELKNSAKTLDEQLKTLKALRDQIELEDDKNKICRMYFLLKEMKASLAMVNLYTPEELERRLCLAWTELSKAKEAARTAKADAEAARDKADRAKTKAADAKSKRRDLILECVDRACPPPPPVKPC